MTRAKICGVTSRTDRDAVIAAGADAFGVIVDVGVETPREIETETATDLVAGAPPFVTSVLVTMPTAGQDVVALQRQVRADAVQVHDRLPPETVGGLAQRLETAVIAVTALEESQLEAYAAAADALLVDARGNDGGGGTGETVDWERARDVVASLDVPVVLAGGLTPENVGEAITTVDPHAVDVASGVERTGGEKDHDDVAAFVRTAHRAGGAA